MANRRLRIGYPAPGNYSLSADTSTYSLSGQAATLTKASEDDSWQLADGHYIAKTSLAQIYPRPDGETGSFARHKKAYYDGTNSIQYRIPVGVRGGALPYRYDLIAGPSGMAIGNTIPSDWAANGPGDYGMVTWTPSSSISSASPTTVTVRVTDQLGATIDVTWTVYTSSSTSDFMFLDSASGSNGNAGSYASPKQTIAGVMTGASNRIIYFKNAGTFSISGDNVLNSGTTPMAFIGVPGVNPIIDFTSGYFSTNASTGSDLFIQNVTWNGGMSGSLDFRNFWGGGVFHRLTVDDLRITNPVNGTVSDGNVSSFYTNSPGGTREYFFFNNCKEGVTGTRRSRSSSVQTNSLFHLFQVRHGLAQFSRILTSTGALFLKESTPEWTLRYNYIDSDANFASGQNEWIGGTLCQTANSVATENVEICYNIWKGGTAGDIDYCMQIIWAQQTPPTGDHWFFRNTMYRTKPRVRLATATNGPFVLENNVVVVNSGATFVSEGGSTTFSRSNTQCEGLASANIINTTTLALTGTSRTLYLGTHGAEIA